MFAWSQDNKANLLSTNNMMFSISLRQLYKQCFSYNFFTNDMPSGHLKECR